MSRIEPVVKMSEAAKRALALQQMRRGMRALHSEGVVRGGCGARGRHRYVVIHVVVHCSDVVHRSDVVGQSWDRWRRRRRRLSCVRF